MLLNDTCKLQSKLIFLIFFLIIIFIAPLCHHHDHPAEYYYNIDSHYVVFDYTDMDIHESFAACHKHSGPHLHIKKDFSGSIVNNGLQSRLQRASVFDSAAYVLNCVEVFYGTVFDHRKFKPVTSFAKAFSGLSPPAC